MSSCEDLQYMRALEEATAMLDTLKMVDKWHIAFEFPDPPAVPDVPDWDSFCSHELESCARLLDAVENKLKRASKCAYERPPACLLYAQLMVSELSEMFDAMAARNMVACLDAAGDLRYVNDGAVRSMGLQYVFHEGFYRIHISNMSKLGPDGRPIKDQTGKVVKGDWYKPVKLDDLIYAQNKNE